MITITLCANRMWNGPLPNRWKNHSDPFGFCLNFQKQIRIHLESFEKFYSYYGIVQFVRGSHSNIKPIYKILFKSKNGCAVLFLGIYVAFEIALVRPGSRTLDPLLHMPTET